MRPFLDAAISSKTSELGFEVFTWRIVLTTLGDIQGLFRMNVLHPEFSCVVNGGGKKRELKSLINFRFAKYSLCAAKFLVPHTLSHV